MQGNPAKSFLLLTSLHHYAEAPTLRDFEPKCNFTLLDDQNSAKKKVSKKKGQYFHVKISISHRIDLSNKKNLSYAL